jgi:hypothetical protein
MSRKWSSKCVDAALKVWASDKMMTSFVKLRDHMGFDRDHPAPDFFEESMKVLKNNCEGRKKARKWRRMTKCLLKYLNMRRTPAFRRTLKRIGRTAKVRNMPAFDDDMRKLVGRFCQLEVK